MFPIIPYNLNQSASRFSAQSSYGNFQKESKGLRVIACCDIPRDTISGLINPEHLIGKLENYSSQIEVKLNSDKQLTLNTNPNFASNNIHWLRAMRLADDCHNYNVRLCLEKSPDDSQYESNHVLLQVLRPIKTGQELVLWFSEEILAKLQMAFLTPANIQGQKKYVCHICSTTYEYPNPLKLHLTLNCNRQQISTLWDQLAKSISNQIEPSNGFELIKIGQSFLNPSKYKINEIQRPMSEPVIHSSAFKPYLSTPRLTQSINNLSKLSSLVSNHETQLLLPTEPISYSHTAQMEKLISNLGKSKQGHLCIYCGKCYSRKYGLKIHIRTHTGYKPLKCKYCLRPFGDPSNLNKHVRLHAEGDTPYKCELCGKVLVRRRDLERHLRSRHMEEMQQVGQKSQQVNSSSEHSDN